MLPPASLERFHLDGFCGPFDLSDPALVDPLLSSVLETRTFVPHATAMPTKHILGENKGKPLLLANAHLENDFVLKVGRDPAILEWLTQLMGNDIWLRRSQFWRKPPGSHGVLWHQDVHRKLGLGDIGEFSAWVALEDSTLENGCVWLLRGSHRAGILPPEDILGAQFNVRFFASDDVIVPKPLQQYEAVPMELKKGQFFLFHQMCFHASGPNKSGAPRTGLAYRYLSDSNIPSITETLTRVAPVQT